MIFARVAGAIVAIGAAAAIDSTINLVLNTFTSSVAATISRFRRCSPAYAILRTGIAVFAWVTCSIAACTCRILITV